MFIKPADKRIEGVRKRFDNQAFLDDPYLYRKPDILTRAWKAAELACNLSKSDLSAPVSALIFILHHSVKLVKFDHKAFKFIDKCVNFKFTVEH